MLPVQHLSHSLESLWQKTGRGRNWALRWEGTAGPKGTQCQQPAPSSLGTAQGSAWQPWRAPLVFLCLVTWGCHVGWGQADGVGMNPAHDPPSGDPPADQAPPSCSRCWFPWNTPKAQHRSTLDSSGSEHLPNHTILWPPGAPCTTKAAQSHPSAPSSRTLVLKQLLKSNPECSKNQSFNSFTSS